MESERVKEIIRGYEDEMKKMDGELKKIVSTEFEEEEEEKKVCFFVLKKIIIILNRRATSEGTGYFGEQSRNRIRFGNSDVRM